MKVVQKVERKQNNPTILIGWKEKSSFQTGKKAQLVKYLLRTRF